MSGDLVLPGIHEVQSRSVIYGEHPNPSWARRSWFSLDGIWNLSKTGRAGKTSSLSEQIQVPFPIGSGVSGVGSKDKGSWLYSRSFSLPDRPESRWILHIGACDHEARIFVNGIALGKHRGGYSSISIDISEASRAGDNSLEILVKDSRSPFLVRGKQSFLPFPFLVWYPGMAGIWQSVWIEETGSLSIADASLEQDFSISMVKGRAWLHSLTWNAKLGQSAVPGREDRKPEGDAELQPEPSLRLEVSLMRPDGSQACLEASGPDLEGGFSFEFGFDTVGGALWSPENPVLHPILYRLVRGSEVLDQVESYFGLRKIGLKDGEFQLNDQALLLRFVLIQGYYPGGSYAAPSRELMEKDILAAKSMGFNGARIHQKVESPYFQYLCDRLGFLTSFEMPSFYLPSRRTFEDFEAELRSLIARDMAHPSCVLRILFNETWGVWGMYGRGSATRRFVVAMTELAKTLDPTRPVIDNSGWEHLGGDILDMHHYLKSPSLARTFYQAIQRRDPAILYGFSVPKVLAFNLFYQVATRTRSLFIDRDALIGDKPLFLSEYGGFGWYETEGKVDTVEQIGEYTRDIVDSDLFCGYCYTQLYDVGSETNGLLTADRKPKVDMNAMRKINEYRKKASPELGEGR